jgi:hypothetical protein
MLWDCVAMTGYDQEARSVWQEALQDLRSRISAIHLVSESLSIRLAARAVSLFIRLPLRAWASESEIVFERTSSRFRPSRSPP